MDGMFLQVLYCDVPPLSMLIDPNALLLKDQSPSTTHHFEDKVGVPYSEVIRSPMSAAVGTPPDNLRLCLRTQRRN